MRVQCAIPSKNQNPREGIETAKSIGGEQLTQLIPSKNQNPREGIETQIILKTLSRSVDPSKNQNPREGIETRKPSASDGSRRMYASKNQNPREGIETIRYTNPVVGDCINRLQKTKIPARGLKLRKQRVFPYFYPFFPSKNQNPREGIET